MCDAYRPCFNAAAATTQPSAVNIPRSLSPQLIQPRQEKGYCKPVKPPNRRASRGEQEDIFTDADWNNVIKGYTSQYVERDYWIDASMIEGASMCILRAPSFWHMPKGCTECLFPTSCQLAPLFCQTPLRRAAKCNAGSVVHAPSCSFCLHCCAISAAISI